VEGYYVNLPAAHKISLNPLRQTLGGRPRLQCSSKLLRSLLSIRYRTADHMTDMTPKRLPSLGWTKHLDN